MIVESFSKHGDDTLGNSKFLGYFQMGTSTLQSSNNSTTRFLSGAWTVNSPQSHIVRVYDAEHGKSGVFHSAEWHDGDWSSDGIREAWLWFFIWVESF
ncbi:hypothetical protein TNCV_3496031 [Trichonephila clavipes]|nr:hypothetical protein TNCV_3496031 [Trichonephila clavipes]